MESRTNEFETCLTSSTRRRGTPRADSHPGRSSDLPAGGRYDRAAARVLLWEMPARMFSRARLVVVLGVALAIGAVSASGAAAQEPPSPPGANPPSCQPTA